MINIGIIGIGGVGGYLGALLSSFYQNSDKVKISLFARGETADKLKRDGLTLKSKEIGKTITTMPNAVYDNCDHSPIMDYMFVCVKSYSVESIIERVAKTIDNNTIIIPFQNGVDGRDKLLKAFPCNRVLDGCVYVMSRIESCGVVVEDGIVGRTHFYYGDPEGDNSYLSELSAILSAAFDHIDIDDNISSRVWTKFSRISTLSTLQTYFGITSGQILEKTIYKEHYVALLLEFIAVAKALGHYLADDLVDISLEYIAVSPYGMTTSMQRDFNDGRSSELEGQCGYISHRAKELGVSTPLYDKIYFDLKSRQQNNG
ncbi:MAG: 2-dehydropantoate 2-reductase [Rikenellaceae bacterium]